VAVLDPDVVLRADGGALRPGRSVVVRGAKAVAERASGFRRFAGTAQPALVNGAAGVVGWAPNGKPFSVVGFTVRGDKIVEMDVVIDPERLSRLDLTDLID
jgi:RNA polymerase sigma-70 factor (ECF subfamily)